MKRNIIYILIILPVFLAITIFTVLSFFAPKNAKAEDKIYAEEFLPKNTDSILDVFDPKDAFVCNGFSAIVLSGNKLVVSNEGEFTDFTNLNQVKLYKDNLFLIENDAAIYLFNPKTSSTTQLKNGNFSIGFNFDYNGKYLVTSADNKAYVYELDSSSTISGESYNVVSIIESGISVDNKTPVAINDNNEIFYIKDGKLWKTNTEYSKSDSICNDISTNKLIANNENVFYIEDNKIRKVNISDGSNVVLTVSGEEKFDIGNIKNPSSISFNGNRLIVCDTEIDTVEEFIVDGSSLLFSGYAFSSNKSAYNRISASASKIERYKDCIAILNDNRITVINDKTDGYNKEDFVNYFEDDFGGKIKDFVLGNNTLLVKCDNSIKYAIDITKGRKDRIYDFNGISANSVTDLCYQTGFYYVLSSNGTNYSLFKINEEDFSIVNEESCNQAFKVLVNPLNNVKYYSNSLIKKSCSDINGNEYLLKSDGKIYFNDKELEIFVGEDKLQNITSFSMSADKKDVYFINNSQRIFVCKNLGNLALTDAPVPSILTQPKTTVEEDTFKIYSLKDNAVGFNVSLTDNNFTFNGKAKAENEFALISSLTIGDTDYKLLSGQNGMIIVNDIFLEEKLFSSNTTINTAYVTTNVHAYFIPVINKGNVFTLSNGEEKVILSHGEKLNVISSVKFLDIEFYYAKVVRNDYEFNCYVPVNFTSKSLSDAENPTLISKTDKDKSKQTLKGVIISLVSVASLCGTACYFILRKKNW